MPSRLQPWALLSLYASVAFIVWTWSGSAWTLAWWWPCNTCGFHSICIYVYMHICIYVYVYIICIYYILCMYVCETTKSVQICDLGPEESILNSEFDEVNPRPLQRRKRLELCMYLWLNALEFIFGRRSSRRSDWNWHWNILTYIIETAFNEFELHWNRCPFEEHWSLIHFAHDIPHAKDLP